jgi:hypothetical protein
LIKSPATPIVEVIDPQDLPILQYAYSDHFSGWDLTIHRVFIKFAVTFQPAIQKLSLRQAMLAYTSAFAPNSSYARMEHYSSLACQQLMRKSPSTFDEADLFAAFLLTMLSCLYQDASNFLLHLFGFSAIMADLVKQGRERYIHCRVFWLLARDLILEKSRRVPGVNDKILKFCQITRPLIGQHRVVDRARYRKELFGPGRPYVPVMLSIWNSYCLLRRCLWHAVTKHLGERINSDAMIHSTLAEVKVDNDGKGEEIEAEFNYKTLQSDRDRTVGARLLYRACKLIIAILEDESIFEGQSPQAIVSEATALMNFIDTARLVPSSAELYTMQSTVAQRMVRMYLPRIICLISFGLGNTIDEERISKSGDTDSVAPKWMIFALESCADLHEMAMKFRLFWQSRDLRYFRDLLSMSEYAPSEIEYTGGLFKV